ncbi:hypothetical protein [Roseicyclus sp.]|uniref:hypothetical protein n=1 Tax=Roseicyclus sp. TaxID=1914329 RepID=UPI003F9F8B19
MPGLCKIAAIVFAVLYAGAVFLFLVGTFGWFGQQRDPLSGVFLIPLGLPWNRILDGLPEATLPWVGLLSPLLNLALLAALCRRLGAGRR